MEERKMNQRSKLYTNILQNVKKSPSPSPKKAKLTWKETEEEEGRMERKEK